MSSQIIPLKGRIDLRESSRILDYSRLRCDVEGTQLIAKISAGMLARMFRLQGRPLSSLPAGSGRPTAISRRLHDEGFGVPIDTDRQYARANATLFPNNQLLQ
jgi:hypothetical protein